MVLTNIARKLILSFRDLQFWKSNSKYLSYFYSYHECVIKHLYKCDLNFVYVRWLDYSTCLSSRFKDQRSLDMSYLNVCLSVCLYFCLILMYFEQPWTCFCALFNDKRVHRVQWTLFHSPTYYIAWGKYRLLKNVIRIFKIYFWNPYILGFWLYYFLWTKLLSEH